MYVSGSKITSQFLQENRRLNMHMSKHLIFFLWCSILEKQKITKRLTSGVWVGGVATETVD